MLEPGYSESHQQPHQTWPRSSRDPADDVGRYRRSTFQVIRENLQNSVGTGHVERRLDRLRPACLEVPVLEPGYSESHQQPHQTWPRSSTDPRDDVGRYRRSTFQLIRENLQNSVGTGHVERRLDRLRPACLEVPVLEPGYSESHQKPHQTWPRSSTDPGDEV